MTLTMEPLAEVARRYLEAAGPGVIDIGELAEEMGRELYEAATEAEKREVYVRRARGALDTLTRSLEPHHFGQLTLEGLNDSWLVLGDSERIRTPDADMSSWLRANAIHVEQNRAQNEAFYRWQEVFGAVTALLATEAPGTLTSAILGLLVPPDTPGE